MIIYLSIYTNYELTYTSAVYSAMHRRCENSVTGAYPTGSEVILPLNIELLNGCFLVRLLTDREWKADDNRHGHGGCHSV